MFSTTLHQLYKQIIHLDIKLSLLAGDSSRSIAQPANMLIFSTFILWLDSNINLLIFADNLLSQTCILLFLLTIF